jgi:hypothetical protein
MDVIRLALFLGFLLSLTLLSLFTIANRAQKQVDDLNNIENAANYIEVFEYSGHEYLRYKSRNEIGGLCHKEDCKFCK